MYKFVKQLVKFIMVGSVAFVVDFGTYTALTRIFSGLLPLYVWVSVCTSALAILVAYFLNHHFTFRQAHAPSMFSAQKYFLVTGTGLVLQNTLLAILVEYIGLFDLVAKFLAVVIIGFAWNFALSRAWVFTGMTHEQVASESET